MSFQNKQGNPLLSVIMPVYNTEKFVGSAIKSILSQTFDNFEFLILDDCSEDHSQEIIQKFNDPRIRFIQNEHNMGVARTLNKGMSLSQGEYIVRMDADDISSPQRFVRQVRHMQEFPDLAICGSWIWWFAGKKEFLLRFPVGRECVCSFLLFGNPLAHPSVIMKRDILKNLGLHYDPECSAAQDFELWSRCWNRCIMDNIPEPLVKWRQNPTGITRSRFSHSNETSLRILRKMLEKLDIAVDDTTLSFHREIGNGSGVDSLERLTVVSEWLTFLLQTNEKRKVFIQEGLWRAAAFVWYRVCLNSSGMGVKVLMRYLKSSLRQGYRPGKEEMLYFLSNAVMKYNKLPTGRISPAQ